MAFDPLSILALLGFTIVLGYIGMIIFERTKIPDIIWLLIFGILVGPILGLIDPALFIAITPLLGALAIIIILFDAGINMDFYQMVKNFPRSILIGTTSVLLSMAGTSILAMYFLGLSLMSGLLLGAIVGSTSSAVVLSLTKKVTVRDNVKSILNLESIFTDPLVIVISLAIINILVLTGSRVNPLAGVLGTFAVGAFIGGISGLLWLIIMDRLKDRQFDYILTLAVLFFVYVFTEYILTELSMNSEMISMSTGAGAIAALFFGLVLGNGVTFSNILRLDKKFSIGNLMRSFETEVAFFIKAFFFVFLGLIVTINLAYLLYGLLIAGMVILMRIVAVQLSTIKINLTSLEKNTIRTMAPRGLAAAVLAQYPAMLGIPGTEIFRDIVFIVILATVIYTVAATQILPRIKFGKKEKIELEPEPKKEAEPTISIPKQLG